MDKLNIIDGKKNEDRKKTEENRQSIKKYHPNLSDKKVIEKYAEISFYFSGKVNQ